jgi:hypothetical protein
MIFGTGADAIEIVFTDDGQIKIYTDPISQPNHTNADKFIKSLVQLMGGKVTYEKRHKHGGPEHTHEHEGKHDHSHG